MNAARRLWTLLEPYHAATYFAPESHAAFEEAGLRGFWRGYFAGRAAPLGAVGAEVVTECFFGFHPDFVARAIPSVWSLVTPEEALAARLRGVDAALGGVGGSAEAAELLRGALEGCAATGLPLFAANRELEWPDPPPLALWHAATLVREHRGDAHVAALRRAGMGPCEAHVTQVAASGAGLESIKPYRGWTEEDWASAAVRLRERGWMDEAGDLTPEGTRARAQVEEETDAAAMAVVDGLGGSELDRLVALLEDVAGRLLATGLVPYPNPMGVPPPGQ